MSRGVVKRRMSEGYEAVPGVRDGEDVAILLRPDGTEAGCWPMSVTVKDVTDRIYEDMDARKLAAATPVPNDREEAIEAGQKWCIENPEAAVRLAEISGLARHVKNESGLWVWEEVDGAASQTLEDVLAGVRLRILSSPTGARRQPDRRAV